MKNSLDETNEGKISVHSKVHRKKVFLTIQDTGKGMSEEERTQIFKPFFSSKKEGMGIGLYLTRKIIEAHDGEIEFETQANKGTTFIIQIPGG